MLQWAGGSWIHDSGSFFSAASITASVHSAIGIALEPREQLSGRPPSASNGKSFTPVPYACTQRTPRATTLARLGLPFAWVSSTSPRTPAGNSPCIGMKISSASGTSRCTRPSSGIGTWVSTRSIGPY